MGLNAPSMLLVATCGVLLWALAPFCCFCLVLFAWDDTQIWLGDLHFVFSPVEVFLDYVATVGFELYRCDLVTRVQFFCLDALISLSSFQDRAFELYRPHSGKTKTPLGGACWFVFGF